MTLLPNVICSFLIIFGISQSCSGKEEAQWKTLSLISQNGWATTAELFNDPTFVYALYTKQPLASSERKCMIVMHEDVNNATKSKQCTFDLDNASSGIIRVENLGSDRAIFVWSDETKKNKMLHWTYRTAVIQMSNCQISDTELAISANSKGWEYGNVAWHLFNIQILVYEQTFEVVVQRAKACGDATDDSNCVYTFDKDGKRVGGPITLYSPEDDEEHYQLKQTSRRSSGKGYWVIRAGREPSVSFLRPADNPKDGLVSVMRWNLGAPMTSTSWNNGMIGICNVQVLSDKMSFQCWQLKEQCRTMRQIDFAVRKSSEASSTTVLMHNLREGGLFVVPVYNDDIQKFYSLSKVDPDSRVIGEPILIGSHSLACQRKLEHTRIIERDDGQYCITLACVERDWQGRTLKMLTKCYTSSSFDRKFYAKQHIEL